MMVWATKGQSEHYIWLETVATGQEYIAMYKHG